MSSDPGLPIVYSCSGCSSAAQTANYIALRLDRGGDAEMSCIAGVGGDVPALVALARSGRPIVVIDGCPLRCARNCLRRHDIEPALPVVLSNYGVKRLPHADFDLRQAHRLACELSSEVRRLAEGCAAPVSNRPTPDA